MGTGAVAMAAGGDTGSGTCECPEVEPPVEITVDCEASYQTQLWAELTIPGAKATDLARIKAVTFYANGNSLVGTPGEYKYALATSLAFKVDTVAAQCWGDRATFVLPADIAEKVAQ
jgi:hypothetical protein